ncbi:hypothetical protein HNR03_003689 [Pseudomonas sp. JAI111]|jgi:hypothetical protein|nr:hypothetical protein [Pseudomonas sp. JAI111]
MERPMHSLACLALSLNGSVPPLPEGPPGSNESHNVRSRSIQLRTSQSQFCFEFFNSHLYSRELYLKAPKQNLCV